jgi:hypothetical protein
MNNTFYNNKIGYTISITLIVIYTIIFESNLNPFFNFFAISFILITVSVIISAKKKLKNLGKVMGIVSAIIVPLTIYGNYTNIKLQKERLEFYKTDTITLKKIFEERNKYPDSVHYKLEIDSLTDN